MVFPFKKSTNFADILIVNKFYIQLKNQFKHVQDEFKRAYLNTVHYEEEQVKRNAIEASLDAGGGSHIITEAKREFWNNAADAAHGGVILSGGNPEQLDDIEKTRLRKMDENPLPDIYKGRTPGRFADDVANLNPLQDALSSAGKAAKDLEKMGISKEGQQIGGAIMGLVGLAGTGTAKLGASEIKDYLAKKFGKDWSKRLTPKDVEVLNDQLIGQGLQVGANGLVTNASAFGNDEDKDLF